MLDETHPAVVSERLSSPWLLYGDIPKLDGFTGPDDEVPHNTAGEDPIGAPGIKAGKTIRP